MSQLASSVSIVGLPGSGKTTLLAALWHMVREQGAVTALTFDGLAQGNYEHLNALAKLWRAGKIQERTQQHGMKTVTMRLKDQAGDAVEVSFPDVPGEEFSRMWEARELDEDMLETLQAPAIVLLVNGDTIQFPAWVAEHMAIVEAAGLARGTPEGEKTVEWTPDLAPTQVQVVDLLQMLMSGELDVGPRRIAVLISAWDKAEGEELSPAEFLREKLPLLDQYLKSNRDGWSWRVWGLSAQGGAYEDPEKKEHFAETDVLRDMARASDRIKLVDGAATTTDITAPLDWLMH